MKTTVVKVRAFARKEFEANKRFVYVGRGVLGWPQSFWRNHYHPLENERPARTRKRTFPESDPLPGFFDDDDLAQEKQAKDRLKKHRDNMKWFHHSNAVVKYEAWLVNTLEGRSVLNRVSELEGKQLGCWCCNWDGTGEPDLPCHAVLLARLADEEYEWSNVHGAFVPWQMS